MTPIVKDLTYVIYNNKEALGIPSTIRMDRLMATGDSVSLSMNALPQTLKEYIDGERVRQASFSVLVVTDEDEANSGQNLAAVGWLDAIGALFEGMRNFELSDKRTILEITQLTMPSLVSRTDAGRITYVMTIGINYRETV